MTREELVAELASRILGIRREHPVRIGIDGVDAAGKTTLADELVEPLERAGRSVIRSSIDGFHRPAKLRKRRGDLSPEGYYRDSFDYPGLIEALLEPLGPGGSRRFRRAIFDFRSDSVVDRAVEEAATDAILVFDGVFLLRPGLRRYWEFSIFVRADFEITVRRAEGRDAELLGGASNVRRRYERRYVPGQRLYLTEAQPERRAAVVIDNNDPARPAMVRRSELRSGR